MKSSTAVAIRVLLAAAVMVTAGCGAGGPAGEGKPGATSSESTSTTSPTPPPSDLLYMQENRVGILDTKGGNRELATDAPTGRDHPDWSPDGQQVAFETAFSELWTVGQDGSGLKRIYQCTRPCSALYDAAWSPNGKQIAFAVAETQDGETTSRSAIKTIDLATSRVSTVYTDTSHRAWIYQPRWSPNGSALVFEQDTFDSNRLDAETVLATRIGVADRRTGRAHFIASAKEDALKTPDWSRAGIVYVSKDNLVLAGPDGSAGRPITSYDGKTKHAVQPTFAADGQEIVFTFVTGEFGSTDHPRAALVKATGGPVVLVSGADGLTHPRLRP